MKTNLPNLEALKKFAEGFLKSHPKGGSFFLSGELGAGKTAFVRFILEVLSERDKVPSPRVVSPSYVYSQVYTVGKIKVFHFDLYRLDRAEPSTLTELGFFEVWESAQAGKYLFVEWAERISPPLNGWTKKLHFTANPHSVEESC